MGITSNLDVCDTINLNESARYESRCFRMETHMAPREVLFEGLREQDILNLPKVEVEESRS